MSISYSDFLLQPVGNTLSVNVGVYVGLVSNNTGTAYKSAAPTDSNGKFTFTVKPPGDTYTVYTSPNGTGLPPGGSWTTYGDANYAIPVVQGENPSFQSTTEQASGPYTPTTGLAGSIQAAAGVSVGTPATSHVPNNLVLTMNGPTIAAESAVVNDIIEFATNATFTGDFTHAWDNGSPDSGFVWGANIYSALGPATGDGVGITALCGLAIGTVFQGPDARPALVVRGAEIGMHSNGAGATGTYLQAESLRVHAAGDQFAGATATPTNAYSLVIESPTKGTSANFAVLQTGSAPWWVTGQLRSQLTSAPGYDASVQVDAAARGKFRDNAGFTFTANSQTTASWVSEGSIPIDNSGGWSNGIYASFRSALGSAVHTGATGLSNAINFWAQSLYPAANASIRAGFAVGTVSEGGNWQFYGGTTDASKLKGNLILTADPGLTFSAAASRIIPGATSMSLRNTANSADNLILLDAGTATFRDNVLFGTTAKGIDTAAGIAELDIGITNATAIKLGNATSLVNFNWGLTAVGGGATATLGTVGGSGPATAAMNGWLKVNVNGTATFIPAWR